MPVSLPHVRRWFAAAGIAVILLVMGVYFYARHNVQNALRQVPEKIGLEIKQSATGFTVSKSDQGRTLFKIQASKAVQFKEGGHAALHDVAITLYGHDSSRYDQIYGSDFDYDPQSGNVTAQGEIQIDLEANPEGVLHPDQAPPKELKNPIHLKTSGLVFNQKTGNASTKEKVEFRLPEASGSAVGVNYVAQTNVLTLESQVKITESGAEGLTLSAAHGVITRDPHHVVLDHPHVETSGRKCDATAATLFLRPDNTISRILASGDVLIQSEGQPQAETRAQQLDLLLTEGATNLKTAVFSGNVQTEITGSQSAHGDAGRVVLTFRGKNLLDHVRAEENVKMVRRHQPSEKSPQAQDMDLTAASVDFFLNKHQHLDHAETSGAAQIAIHTPADNNSQTLVTAGKFDAHFDDTGQLASLHGAPNARIVNQNGGQPDRTSSSQTLDVAFLPVGGIDSIVQEGSVAYEDGQRKAWGEHARYTPRDQMLVLTGTPRVVDSGMTTTATTMRMNRATGDAFAQGNVKSTYSDLKAEPNGALLASASPIHVTSRTVIVHGSSAVAQYDGDVRLWQDANVVDAPSIEFDRDHRSMIARGSANHPVSTVLVQTDQEGKAAPVALTSSRLVYTDSERRAHLDEDVVAKSGDVTITSKQMDAFLQARGPMDNSQASPAGKLDKIVASGQVVITQPSRHGEGSKLTYTTADDKLVLTGGPPSIFDAERGKITGVSLTFFRHDDRVLVEGSNSSPTVTKTRVAR